MALDTWPGGYILRTDGRFAHVPRHVDVTAGHRLFKPVEDSSVVDALCRPGDTVLDIGANVGDWTMPFAIRVGPTGKVVAFEPVPYLAETIAKTARINRQSWVEVHAIALSSEDGAAEFSVERGNSGGSRLGKADGDFSAMTVRTSRLDTFMQGRPEIDRIDLIKIDVEGYEHAVLAGALETLARARPAVILESGLEDSSKRLIICESLESLKYEIVGALVPGGIVEISWQDFRMGTNEVARLGLCNYLFMADPANLHA